MCGPTLGADPVGDRVEGRLGATGEVHGGAFASEGLCHGTSYRAGASGDDRVLAFEQHACLLRSVSSRSDEYQYPNPPVVM